VVLSFAVLLHLGLLPRDTQEAEQDIEAHFHTDEPLPNSSTAEKPPPAAPATESKAAAGAANTAADSKLREEAAPEDAASWLRRIRALRAEGKVAEAEREWQAFRKAWPDYPVDRP
jgi:hypothetical protein